MKIFVAVALSSLMAVTVQAQTRTGTAAAAGASASMAPTSTSTGAGPTSSTPAAQAKIDPVKEADIHRLLDVTGASTLMNQILGNLEQNIKPLIANSLPPGDYRDKLIDLFLQKFNSKLDMKQLLDLAVARYDENFSDEEIKGLTAFYETPLGHKVVTVLPTLTGQLQQDGQKLGQQAGRDAMLEVLAEHPELAQALQEAAAHRNAPRQQ